VIRWHEPIPISASRDHLPTTENTLDEIGSRHDALMGHPLIGRDREVGELSE